MMEAFAGTGGTPAAVVEVSAFVRVVFVEVELDEHPPRMRMLSSGMAASHRVHWIFVTVDMVSLRGPNGDAPLPTEASIDCSCRRANVAFLYSAERGVRRAEFRRPFGGGSAFEVARAGQNPTRRRRGLWLIRLVTVLMLAMGFLILRTAAAGAAPPPGLSWGSGQSEAYMYPADPGMSSTTGYVAYCLANPSNVTVTVLNSSSQVVKTIQTGVSEPATCEGVTWDGTNDSGQIVAPGQYTIDIVATDSGGQSTLETVRDVANPGAPGSLTTPTSGATLSGTTAFVFTPSTSFTATNTITQVSVRCIGNATTASANGTWQGSGSSTECGNGSQVLNDYVYFKDPLGNGQSWTDPNPPSVTFSSPPGLSWDSGQSEAYMYPADPGMSSTTGYVAYCLANPSNVTVTVLNSSSQVVKTIQTGVSEPATCEGVTWDGTNDSGQIVAPGQYTIDIVATDSGGQSTLETVRDVANPGAPGSLTTPTSGATLSGTTAFVFTPSTSFTATNTITQVSVRCIGVSYSASANGTWQGSGSSTECGNGSQVLNDYVYFKDPLGNGQSWTDPNPPSVRGGGGGEREGGGGGRSGGGRSVGTERSPDSLGLRSLPTVRFKPVRPSPRLSSACRIGAVWRPTTLDPTEPGRRPNSRGR